MAAQIQARSPVVLPTNHPEMCKYGALAQECSATWPVPWLFVFLPN